MMFEDLVMVFQWFNTIHNGAQDDHIKILDATIRGLTKENPIEFGQDLAPEDDLSECSRILNRKLRNLEPFICIFLLMDQFRCFGREQFL